MRNTHEKGFVFSTRSEFATDKRVYALDRKGITGYGIYWGIIEYLRSQDDYIGDLRVVKILAKQMRTSTARILRILTNYGLFVIEDDSFQSIKLNILMQPLERKRRQMDRLSRWDYKTINLRNCRNPLTDNDTLFTVKKSKVEKILLPLHPQKKYVSPMICFLHKLRWEEYWEGEDREQQWE